MCQWKSEINILKLSGEIIAGLRDILAHSYFSLEDEILWNIVKNKIAPLLEQVKDILLKLEKDNFC